MKIYEMADDGSVTWFDGLEDMERMAKAYMDITNRDRARYNKALRHRGEWGKTYERL